VIQRLGGVHVYVPGQRAVDRKRVTQQIRDSFDGCNAFELSRRFGLSLRQVQRIVLMDSVSTPTRM